MAEMELTNLAVHKQWKDMKTIIKKKLNDNLQGLTCRDLLEIHLKRTLSITLEDCFTDITPDNAIDCKMCALELSNLFHQCKAPDD